MEINNDSIVLPLPTDTFLEKEEKMWRVALPKSYKDFLKKYNGGTPEHKSFYTQNHFYAIDRFLCVLEETENNEFGIYDIDVTLTRIEERLTDNEDLIGADLLPIATLFAGDYLCLDYRISKNHPAVCVWDHKESGELDPMTYFTAKNFEEFIGML